LLLREVALAYARIGDWQATCTASIPEDPEAALASHRQSMELFAALAENHRNNAQAQRDLAVSQEKVRRLERSLSPGIEAHSSDRGP
jgi:hypothetical protein